MIYILEVTSWFIFIIVIYLQILNQKCQEKWKLHGILFKITCYLLVYWQTPLFIVVALWIAVSAIRDRCPPWCVRKSQWWSFLTMVSSGNRASGWSLVNYPPKTIHHHHVSNNTSKPWYKKEPREKTLNYNSPASTLDEEL